jgi:hypothetical protein
VNRLLAACILMLAGVASAPCLAQDAPLAPAVTQNEPQNLGLAQEVIDLAFPPDRRHALLSRVGDAMMEQMRNAALGSAGGTLDAGEEPIFQRYLARVREISEEAITERSPALFNALARAYARAFTRDELVQIRAFVATPAGAKYLQRSADLLSDPDVAQANTDYMRSAFTLIEPLTSQLRQELTEYRAHHRR